MAALIIDANTTQAQKSFRHGCSCCSNYGDAFATWDGWVVTTQLSRRQILKKYGLKVSSVRDFYI